MVQTKLQFIKRAIYKLKRSYGLPVQLYKIDSSTLDTETGVKNTILDVIYVRNALVLRAREFRSFVYDLAYISANKDFTTGGYFDAEDRVVVFDMDDTLAFSPEPGDFVLADNVRYYILEVLKFEANSIYAAACRRVRGAPSLRIETELSVVLFEQDATYEIIDNLTQGVKSVLNLTQTLIENPSAELLLRSADSVLTLTPSGAVELILAGGGGPPRSGFGPLR